MVGHRVLSLLSYSYITLYKSEFEMISFCIKIGGSEPVELVHTFHLGFSFSLKSWYIFYVLMRVNILRQSLVVPDLKFFWTPLRHKNNRSVAVRV